jgi:hypothetical protein
MSDYTITLGEILANAIDIGLDDYPIFDENYRDTLNTRIESFYYDHEIGFETTEQFIRRLEAAYISGYRL